MILRMLGAILFGGGSFGAFAGWLLCKWLDARQDQLRAKTDRVRRIADPVRSRSPAPPARSQQRDGSIRRRPKPTPEPGGLPPVEPEPRPSWMADEVACERFYAHPSHIWERDYRRYWCHGRNDDGTEPYDPRSNA